MLAESGERIDMPPFISGLFHNVDFLIHVFDEWNHGGVVVHCHDFTRYRVGHHIRQQIFVGLVFNTLRFYH
ncbi:hypothetical protein SAMN02745132_02521 [Enterovibrio nigricans DSM 22720]|uniref:Uncharacterized protein n=1 Tax=Enterovibrio nigricans DSM 22720 TaxID=1121868 RepID=A0A1T4UTZ6_9GAMM|nr:hypothetical protein SAMN02745132_02521 [Enterovibrio nigricans DSM 22720]